MAGHLRPAGGASPGCGPFIDDCRRGDMASVALHEYTDLYGNICQRFVLGPGSVRIRYEAEVVVDSGVDEVDETATQAAVADLPELDAPFHARESLLRVGPARKHRLADVRRRRSGMAARPGCGRLGAQPHHVPARDQRNVHRRGGHLSPARGCLPRLCATGGGIPARAQRPRALLLRIPAGHRH